MQAIQSAQHAFRPDSANRVEYLQRKILLCISVSPKITSLMNISIQPITRISFNDIFVRFLIIESHTPIVVSYTRLDSDNTHFSYKLLNNEKLPSQYD